MNDIGEFTRTRIPFAEYRRKYVKISIKSGFLHVRPNTQPIQMCFPN